MKGATRQFLNESRWTEWLPPLLTVVLPMLASVAGAASDAQIAEGRELAMGRSKGNCLALFSIDFGSPLTAKAEYHRLDGLTFLAAARQALAEIRLMRRGR